MKLKSITIIFPVLFLAACGNQKNETEVTVEQAPLESEHDHDSEAIELNNGQKWVVNDSMMIHIRNMENDVNAFNGKAVAEYQNLASGLQENINLLTSNCTMTGKAHDELHKWLLPYIDTVDEFAAQTVESEYAKQLEIIKTSLATFNQYFE